MRNGALIGYGGAVDQILDVLPLDSTSHVTDCGYDDNDGRCRCYDLPSRLGKIIAAAKAEAWDEGYAVSRPRPDTNPTPNPYRDQP
jgi:hypothetical protein